MITKIAAEHLPHEQSKCRWYTAWTKNQRILLYTGYLKRDTLMEHRKYVYFKNLK
jgi:hypothetical protein